jgi:D-glycero-alpha-D-manno-heptose-7-phosphate kinase
MIVVKSSLRVSLFGGGTDFPSYYEEHGSTIISFALNLRMHTVWNKRPTGGCRLSYSRVEELPSLRDAEHTIVRACANEHGFAEPCTLTIISDVPAGTGLGSSSALSVTLCELMSLEDVPHAAFALERSISPVGIQDHLPAFYGGFRVYDIKPDSITSTLVPRGISNLVQAYGLLLYTGKNRDANKILGNWEKDTGILKDIQVLALDVKRNLDTISIGGLSHYLSHTWKIKSSIKGVVDDTLLSQYNEAINNGALAGKLLGAGGGGCWFFLAHPSVHNRITDSLGLTRLPFAISETGVEMRTV